MKEVIWIDENDEEHFSSIKNFYENKFALNEVKKIKIEDGVKKLPYDFFYNLKHLEFAYLPDSLIDAEYLIFDNCLQIQNIRLPKKLKMIGDNFFDNCRSLEKIELPDTLEEIKSYAFNGCKSLLEIKIPKSVSMIENDAFVDCVKLKSIELSNNVESLGANVFSGCLNLEKVVLPKTLKKIEASSFFNCSALKKIDLPPNLVSLENDAFSGCTSLTNISLPNSVKTIGKRAFNNCSSMKNIKIPNSVVELSSMAFLHCENLENIELSDNITILENGTFSECVNLKNVKLPQNLEIIEDYVFSECPNIDTLTLPNSVKRIEDFAFSHCGVKEISLPNDLEYLGNQAFRICCNLKKIKIPPKITSISEQCFESCIKLEEVEFHNNITKIGHSAFESCTSLKRLILPSSLQIVENYAFSNCVQLNHVYIPQNTMINSNALYNCPSLQYIYIDKNGALCITDNVDEELEKTCIRREMNNSNIDYMSNQFRKNWAKINSLKNDGKIKFIPPDYVLSLMPSSELDSFFSNNNHKRWEKLVRTLKFDTLDNNKKFNTLDGLFKIYYAIGGFSKNQIDSEQAYDYIINYVANRNEVMKSDEIIKHSKQQKDFLNMLDNSNKQTDNSRKPKNISSEESLNNIATIMMANNMHRNFSEIRLDGPFNAMFAKFFMRYYKYNPNFMVLDLHKNSFQIRDDEYDDDSSWLNDGNKHNYLCQAHNRFNQIMRNYPNMVVSGTTDRRALLTPEFVAQKCVEIRYDNVLEGNEKLASLIGAYSYSQQDFEYIQSIYEDAKKEKDNFVIKAEKSNDNSAITYRLLAKDDPLGFVIGHITTCCQHIGGPGGSCVIDGYSNPCSGFVVFETNYDLNQNELKEKRIIGQAYIWYDEKNKTLCFDNIEIPDPLLKSLKNHKNSEISLDALMKAVENCAESIMKAMNIDKVMVEKITIGEGYNDLIAQLELRYSKDLNPQAHAPSGVYTDAEHGQYIVKTYDALTKNTHNQITQKLAQMQESINDMQSNSTKNIFNMEQ